MKKLWIAVAMGAWLVGTARAQVRPEAAEKLFRDGKAMMKEGKLAEACGAFEASEKAEHSIATVLSLADCREKNGQLASAWGLFLQVLSQNRKAGQQDPNNVVATKRSAALEGRLSYLTISVPDGSRVTGLVVSRNGVTIDAAEWNVAIPVDGGAHEISGKAPGHEAWSTKVTVQPERDKQSVEVPRFKELPELAVPPEARLVGGGAVVTAPPAPSPFTTKRKIAIGVAAGGVVLAGVGLGFGFDARGLRSEALAACPVGSCSGQGAADANALNDRARSRALVANIGFAAGGAAVIAGAVLWFVGGPRAPEPGSREVAVSPLVGETSGFVVSGRF